MTSDFVIAGNMGRVRMCSRGVLGDGAEAGAIAARAIEAHQMHWRVMDIGADPLPAQALEGRVRSIAGASRTT